MSKNMILGLAILLLACGCEQASVKEGASPGVRVRDARAPQAEVQYNTAVFLDKSLQRWYGVGDADKYAKITVESTDSRRTPTGTLDAWAVLRNRTDHRLQVEGRVQFFDKNKVPCEAPSAWQRLYLNPQSIETYHGLSTQVDNVTYYYIELREGR